MINSWFVFILNNEAHSCLMVNAVSKTSAFMIMEKHYPAQPLKYPIKTFQEYCNDWELDAESELQEQIIEYRADTGWKLAIQPGTIIVMK